jgi:hypothetical protein
MNELINSGICTVGNKPKDLRPIIVVGTARSGTSMIAGALDKLGIFMGDQAKPPVYEDLRLSDAIEAKNIELSREIIADYTSRNKMWGWKRPSSLNYLTGIDKLFNKPYYVFVFKDILSISLRNKISANSDLIKNMLRVNLELHKMIRFLSEVDCYALLVSYDKALSEPKNFVNSLISFYDINASESQISSAISFIRKDPIDYLISSRILDINGRIDTVSQNTVEGWAFRKESKDPVQVDIYLNKKVIGKAIANLPRSDLEVAFARDCSFIYHLPAGVSFRENDSITAKISGEPNDIVGSPHIVSR